MNRSPEIWHGWSGPDARLDVQGSVQATCCPTCARSLSWVTSKHLRSIEVAWRCAPGQQPLTFEVSCAGCQAFLVSIVSHSGVTFKVGEEARRLHQHGLDRSRQHLAERYERDE